jgi:hypothetical protein
MSYCNGDGCNYKIDNYETEHSCGFCVRVYCRYCDQTHIEKYGKIEVKEKGIVVDKSKNCYECIKVNDPIKKYYDDMRKTYGK